MIIAPLRIGIYGVAFQEIVRRPFTGAVRYAEETSGLLVRDFRMGEEGDDIMLSVPPWKDRVDGVIVSMGREIGATDKNMADWVLSGGVPAVSVAADWKDPRIPCFHTDNQSLGNLAAKHLLACECQSFLFVGFAGSTGSPNRGIALKTALTKQGKRLSEHATQNLLVGTYNDEAHIRSEKGLIELLLKLKKPIGVWTLNDNFSGGICVLCDDLELNIPKQVKVLGVDDLLIARTHRPTLSSIRTPGERIGYLAMQTLHGILHGKAGPRKATEVPATELIGRVSTLGERYGDFNLDEILDYIKKHACSGLSVDQLYKSLNMSRRAFELRFRSLRGCSPGEEIQRVRLERAKELLRGTELSISRIASMIGYAETAAFSKFFSNQTGMSPLNYRKSAD